MNPLRASAVSIPLERNSSGGGGGSGGDGGSGVLPRTGSAPVLVPLGASPDGNPGGVMDGATGGSLGSMGDGGQGGPPQQQHW
jgi:hypothetical protein